MSFLAPLFLFGAAAIVGPILFHLIRRTTKERTLFSTLMFLEPSPPRITRRSRIEHLWLLLLRCAALALLAFGFARPFFPAKQDAAAGMSAHFARRVILVDSSASMRRDGLAEAARRKVIDAIDHAAPGDEVAVFFFAEETVPGMTFSEWRTAGRAAALPVMKSRLSEWQPGWGGTRLDAALRHAADAIEQEPGDAPSRREIFVVSDLQEGARLDAVQGHEWPPGTRVLLEAVVPSVPAWNASAAWLSSGEALENQASPASMRIRIANAPEASRDQFSLRWFSPGGEAAGPPIPMYIPAGQVRIASIPLPPDGSTKLMLEGDEVSFDNALHIVPPRPARIRLLYAGRDAEDDPRAALWFLKRAFPSTARQQVEIAVHRAETPIPAPALDAAQMLVLGEAPAEPVLDSARAFATAGKLVLLPMHSAADTIRIGRLIEAAAPPCTEAAIKNYALLGQIDFAHPLFAPFADPRFSDFARMHFWKYRRLDLPATMPAEIIARFDSRDPAIVRIPSGKGSVVVLASTWRPQDSQLALSSKFVPLLHSLLDLSAPRAAAREQAFVGEAVPLPPTPEPLVVRTPSGREIAAMGGETFRETSEPGIYSIEPGGHRFAVNLSPEESRLAPLPRERFTSLGVPIESAVEAPLEARAAAAKAIAAAEAEGRQRIWRWLILGCIAAVVLETLIAGKLSASLARSTPESP